MCFGLCSTLVLVLAQPQPTQPTQTSKQEGWKKYPLQDALEWYCTANATAADEPTCRNFGFWLRGHRATVAVEQQKLRKEQRAYLASLTQEEYATLSADLSSRPVLLQKYCRHAPQAPQCTGEHMQHIMTRIAHWAEQPGSDGSGKGKGKGRGGKGRGGKGRGRGGKGKGKGRGRGSR